MDTKAKLMSALLKPNARYKFRDLKEITGASNRKLNQLFQEIRREGVKLVFGRFDRMYYISRIPTPYSDYFDMTWLPLRGKLGLISDTHLCSVAERLDLLEAAYDDFVKQGITTVIHAGDIMDGWDVFKGHIQSVKVVGGTKQAVYCIENYPQRKGIKTYFIGGNHDLRSCEKTGIDQCSLVVNGFDFEGKHYPGRTDLVYLGQYSRTLLFPGDVTVQVIHPRGANPYAKSYAQQKRAREMRSETRPNMQISGHMHVFTWIVEDITHMLALPGFQDETEFFVRLGYPRNIGYCIVDYSIERRKFNRIRVECIDSV